MTQLPEAAVSQPGPFGELRVECRDRGIDTSHITDLALGYIVAAVDGNMGLAADALEMDPRPLWVQEFTGPHGRGE